MLAKEAGGDVFATLAIGETPIAQDATQKLEHFDARPSKANPSQVKRVFGYLDLFGADQVAYLLNAISTKARPISASGL